MIEFRRDPDTGILYAYKDGKLIGPIVTMGDEIKEGSEPTVAKSAKRKIEMLRTQNIGPQKRKEQTTDGEDK